MKEELSEKLVASLDRIQEYIETTEEFVIEQAPLVAQEIITLGRIESAWCVLAPMLIALLACLYMWFNVGRIFPKERPDYLSPRTDLRHVLFIFSLLTGIIASFVSIVNMNGLFEPWFAPRMYLLHEIGNLL